MDIKKYCNERYDVEDPDNSYNIHKIDILLDYLKVL